MTAEPRGASVWVTAIICLCAVLIAPILPMLIIPFFNDIGNWSLYSNFLFDEEIFKFYSMPSGLLFIIIFLILTFSHYAAWEIKSGAIGCATSMALAISLLVFVLYITDPWQGVGVIWLSFLCLPATAIIGVFVGWAFARFVRKIKKPNRATTA